MRAIERLLVGTRIIEAGELFEVEEHRVERLLRRGLAEEATSPSRSPESGDRLQTEESVLVEVTTSTGAGDVSMPDPATDASDSEDDEETEAPDLQDYPRPRRERRRR